MSERCEICGDCRPNSMEEHHILPRRFGGDDSDENLVTLCASCHRAVESIYNKRFWVSVGLRPSNRENTIQEYIERRLTFDEAAEPVPKAELYAKYKEWCRAGDVEPASQHKFSRTLQRIDGVDSGRAYIDSEMQVRCYTGVRETSLTEAQ